MSELGQSGKRPKTGGRQKGTPNKMTGEVKAMILEALDQAGGVSYLVSKAESHPQAFMALVGKVLPLQVTGGEDGDNPIQHALKIEFVDVGAVPGKP